ncbi:MAG: hypothetical protein IKQ33_01210 [Clostridia bacterium]|nr:hypothetical protein [Clostridia bacterium]
MKKSLFFILIFFVLATFVSCKDPNTEQPAETQTVSAGEDSWIINSKSIWQKVVGKEFYDRFAYNTYDTIAFTENKIVVDGNEYSITFLNETEIANLQYFEGKNAFCFISFALGTFCLKYEYLAPAGNYMDLEDTYLSLCSYSGNNYTVFDMYEYKGVYNSGNNGSSLTDVTGTYSFNDASGSGQVNGNIVLNDDGTWDSNSTKLTSAISNKNYTVNGNKITFNWTANGMSVSTEVTVTDNGSSLTFEANNVNLFSMLFGVVSTSITVTKQ